MNYTPNAVPNDPASIPEFLQRELSVISRTLQGKVSSVWMAPRNVAPDKPRDGLLVKADGTNWDPGSGEGVYCYYGAAWHYLG